MTNQYSQASHLIHSRLEMIRSRLEIREHELAANIVYKYREILDRAAASVQSQHGITSTYKDIFDAAQMLHNCLFPPPSKNAIRYHVVQFNDHKAGTWVDIAWWTKEDGIRLADPDERLTNRQALERFNSMNVGKLVIFRTRGKWDEPKLPGKEGDPGNDSG